MADRKSDSILCYLVHRTLYGELVTQLNEIDYGSKLLNLSLDTDVVIKYIRKVIKQAGGAK